MHNSIDRIFREESNGNTSSALPAFAYNAEREKNNQAVTKK